MRFVTARGKTDTPEFASEAARLRALAAEATTLRMRQRLIELAEEIARGKAADGID